MKKNMLLFAVIVLGAVLIFTLGCARTKPAKFYTLNSLDAWNTENRTPSAGPGLALGIGPVSFPDYLDRPQIASRNSRNMLNFEEFHRWAGSFKQDFSRVLAENLSNLLATDRIALFPWKSTAPIDYRVAANVIRFEGRTAGDVTLKVRWTILNSTGEQVLGMKMSSVTEPVKGNNYEALVAAHSRALESLSREIAEAINTISEEGCE